MIIYKITNKINNKIYVGKQVNIRKNNNYLGSGKLIKLSVKKYGKENFQKDILQECQTNDELNIFEKIWIERLNSLIPNGYNISTGGDGGDTISNNPNKESIMEKQTNTKKVNGVKGSMFGKNQSEETKLLISKKIKELYADGKIKRNRMTADGKRRISEFMKLNCPTKTPDGRIKNSINNTGIKNPNSHIYEFISPNNTKFEVNGNIKKFCLEHELSYKKIIKVHKGIIDNVNGWKCIKICKSNI